MPSIQISLHGTPRRRMHLGEVLQMGLRPFKPRAKRSYVEDGHIEPKHGFPKLPMLALAGLASAAGFFLVSQAPVELHAFAAGRLVIEESSRRTRNPLHQKRSENRLRSDIIKSYPRRVGRVAEGGGLLNRYRIKSSIGGSNPPTLRQSIFPDS